MSDPNNVNVGGIVLCGGKSTRMGLPKATLPFGPELMLQRVVRLLGEVVQPIVVVTAPHQPLPDLPPSVIITSDNRTNRGPLEGINAGLTAIESFAEAAYITSCDVPLLVGDFVRLLISALGNRQIVVPTDGHFHHPLAAVYRTSVLPQLDSLLDSDQLRPVFLFDLVDTLCVPVEKLRLADPNLLTLTNLNCPDDYVQCLKLAGYEVDPEVFQESE